MAYGIYSVADGNFFPGVVAAINSLRLHGCRAPLAIVDIGLDGWMRHYLEQFGDVKVLDIQPLVGRVRYTDVKSCEEPVMRHWAYKAFAIAHYDLFARFTFIDADFLPLCDLERELSPRIDRGEFVSSADGWNTWGEAHREAIGVEPGTYLNVNAGFFSLDMAVHGAVIREWRDLMTRSRPFDLWYGDQGALNAILDKYCVPKTALDPLLWNQTWLNEELAAGDAVVRHGRRLLHRPTGLQVKCQATRQQGLNRFIARRLLLDKLEMLRTGAVASERARVEKIRRQKRRRSRRSKQRMLADKAHHAAKKESRRRAEPE